MIVFQPNVLKTVHQHVGRLKPSAILWPQSVIATRCTLLTDVVRFGDPRRIRQPQVRQSSGLSATHLINGFRVLGDHTIGVPQHDVWLHDTGLYYDAITTNRFGLFYNEQHTFYFRMKPGLVRTNHHPRRHSPQRQLPPAEFAQRPICQQPPLCQPVSCVCFSSATTYFPTLNIVDIEL